MYVGFILPPLLNRTLELGDTWAHWPAKPSSSLLSIGIGTKNDASILKQREKQCTRAGRENP